MKKFVVLFVLVGIGSLSAQAKVDKDKCQKLAKNFSIIGSESESGDEAIKLNELLQEARSGSDKENSKTHFCAMYFAQSSYVEANYKYMLDDKCDTFEQFNVAWKTASDHLKNRFKPQVEGLCLKENRPGFSSGKNFARAHDNYMKYYEKMLGDNKLIRKKAFKLW